jgi:hypothetical protein
MAKSSNIVHQYFKKQVGEGAIILVKVNPLLFTGTEISVLPSGEVEMREMEFDEQIFEDLNEDGFLESSPLEFNLYYSGLV